MSNRTVDNYMLRDHLRGEFGCCECGYMRGNGHHPGIRCPKSGHCGECGNDWPCADHAHLVPEKIPRGKPLSEEQTIEVELRVLVHYTGVINKTKSPKLEDVAAQAKDILDHHMPIPKLKVGKEIIEDKVWVEVYPRYRTIGYVLGDESPSLTAELNELPVRQADGAACLKERNVMLIARRGDRLIEQLRSRIRQLEAQLGKAKQ